MHRIFAKELCCMVVQDIMISGAPAMPDGKKTVGRLNHMHVANRFRYSLRVSFKQKIWFYNIHVDLWYVCNGLLAQHFQVYASILYLQLPKHFKVILCGQVVEPHHIVNDLIYCECIKYRPQVGINIEVCSNQLCLKPDSRCRSTTTKILFTFTFHLITVIILQRQLTLYCNMIPFYLIHFHFIYSGWRYYYNWLLKRCSKTGYTWI